MAAVVAGRSWVEKWMNSNCNGRGEICIGNRDVTVFSAGAMHKNSTQDDII